MSDVVIQHFEGENGPSEDLIEFLGASKQQTKTRGLCNLWKINVGQRLKPLNYFLTNIDWALIVSRSTSVRKHRQICGDDKRREKLHLAVHSISIFSVFNPFFQKSHENH